MTRMQGDLIGPFTGPGEVKALQQTIKAQFENVRTALQRCATAGTFTPDKTPGDWGAWQSLKTRVEAYVAEAPSWFSTVSQYERGEALQKEVLTWYDKARTLGCDAGVTPPAPTSDPPILSTAGLSQLLVPALVIWFLLNKKW